MKTNTYNLNLTGGKSKWTPPSSIVVVIFIFVFYSLHTKPLYAQGVAINITGQAPKSSAVLDLSTGNGGKYGFLAPKVALQATNVAAPITTPSNGLVVYDTVTAGSAPYTVNEGFYYWNSTSSLWVGLNSAPNIPYGNNVHSWAATSNIGPAPAAFAAMGPTITFTPVHSVVYLTFTSGGFVVAPSGTVQNVQYEVLNGATVLAGGSSICEAYTVTGIFGNAASSYNFSILLPIAVTPGVSTTISIDWKTTAFGAAADPVMSDASTYPSDSHATMFIND